LYVGANVLRVGVVGLGLIGGSILRGLVKANQASFEVTAYDTDTEVQAAAEAEGFVLATSFEQIWESTDLLFLATPIGVTLDLLADLGAEGPLITDVCSVKRSVMQAARDSNLSRFIGGHPMTGSHRAGWPAGDEGLLRGAVWALVLEEATELAAWAEVAQVILALGARIAPVTAAAHDLAVGGVSHAAHVVAAAYANSLTRATSMPLALTLAAGSFRDLTRVTLSPESRTAEMLIENGDDVAEVGQVVAEEVGRFSKLLAKRDLAGVTSELATAGELRRKYDRLMSSQAQTGRLIDAPNVVALVEALRQFVDTGALIADITHVSGDSDLWRAVVLEPEFTS